MWSPYFIRSLFSYFSHVVSKSKKLLSSLKLLSMNIGNVWYVKNVRKISMFIRHVAFSETWLRKMIVAVDYFSSSINWSFIKNLFIKWCGLEFNFYDQKIIWNIRLVLSINLNMNTNLSKNGYKKLMLIPWMVFCRMLKNIQMFVEYSRHLAYPSCNTASFLKKIVKKWIYSCEKAPH